MDGGPTTEAETRRELIDQKLRMAGWDLKNPAQVIEELDIDLAAAGVSVVADPKSPYSGHQFSDYGLLLHGKPVAVVEAKRTSKDAELGQEQALQYARNLQKIHGGPIPLIFYTNGYDIFFWESDFYPPVKVHGFPSRDDLDWLQQRRETRRPLSVEMINTDIAGRDYQIGAIRKILEKIEGKHRKLLLVMATGTGKTRTAVGLVDLLTRARWAKRILFLVDRIALRDQALDAFKEHMPAEPRWPLPQDGRGFVSNRRIYVTTYPTMLNMIQNGTTPQTWISPYFFDLVIADESHRSIYNTYLQVLQYFNAIRLGLTATPTDRIDHDTFKLFECDLHDPTYAYSYEEAVRHDPPFLCDYEVLRVRSKFQLEGIKGGVLPDSVQKQLIAEGKDPAEIDFEGTDLERKVTNSGTNALIVREFMEECIKDPTGTLPGKSIIFAISKGHARRLQALFDTLYPEHKGKLARVLVSDDRFVYGKGGLLDQFKTQNYPRVAISVDMLDTGVDIREVVNLVFAKPVYSYVKFWQMIGRGTRVLEVEPAKRRAWCPDKDGFLIIDCWGNFEFFQMHPRGREPRPQVPLPVKLFRSRLDKLEAAVCVERADVAGPVVGNLRADLADLPANNVVVLDARAELDKVSTDQFWEQLDVNGVGFLRSVIAPVLRARSSSAYKAMHFEMEVVQLGTALLVDNTDAFEALKATVIEEVGQLPLSVNVVAREKAFIDEVLHEHWWSEPTDAKLRELADRLAPLMKYRRTDKPAMVKLSIEDLLTVKEWVEFGPHHERMPTSAYRERVEAHVRAMVAENPALQRLEAGDDLTDSEVVDLALALREEDPHVTEDLLRKVYDHRTARFLQFIRHILGLERLESWSSTVGRAFDDFISEHTTFTSLQIQFLQTLRTFILQTGTLEKRDLIQAPFTQVHPDGVRGVFRPTEIEEILGLARELVA